METCQDTPWDDEWLTRWLGVSVKVDKREFPQRHILDWLHGCEPSHGIRMQYDAR